MDLALSSSGSRAFLSLFKPSSFSSQPPPLLALYLLFLILLHPSDGFLEPLGFSVSEKVMCIPVYLILLHSCSSMLVFGQLKLKELVLNSGLEPACLRELHCTFEELPNVVRYSCLVTLIVSSLHFLRGIADFYQCLTRNLDF